MAKIKAAAKKNRGNKHFPIVAIGASAGGLEAVTELLKNLSPQTGMAYVYIQHLDPTHKSMLSEILARVTKMKVLEAGHLLPIQPDHFYIIPPNKDLSIIDGVLKLNPRAPKPSVHMPVDKFFHSLADKQNDGSIGIVLSGNAHDGTFGLKSIKLAGGLTFAQDDSARFQSMPKSAIAEGVVDMVLSPKEMAKELERISQHLTASPKAISAMEEEEAAEKEFSEIIQLMRKATGVDFSHYKINTIRRRILRRMLIHKLESFEEYYQYLKQHAGEVNTLYQDMLIHVTSFFRDADLLDHLKAVILPKLIETKIASLPIRIWIPACATGEEAYSIAMIFLEVLSEKNLNRQVQIFATDLSEVAVARARLGLYSASDLEHLKPERLERFFEKVDGSYRVLKSVRDLCVFATQNVFKDPPFSKIDLISCCNLLIYLDAVLQKKILSIFHYSLNNSGYLVLGKSETINAVPELFSQVEKKFKLFSKKKDKSTNVVFDMNYRLQGTEHTVSPKHLSRSVQKEAIKAVSMDKTIDDILLRQFVAPSVLINRHMEILQFWGSTQLFLEASHGKASLNLLKMARPGLTFELRNIVHKVIKSGERVKKSGLQIKVKDIIHHVSIEVLPIFSDDDEQLFLVVFEELAPSVYPTEQSSLTKDKLVAKLQDELASAKEDMRSMIEEQEAGLEELQSANEEIVSSNEELQSINEELETSKEEVESSNEELLTINNELQVRNNQLTEAYEYSEVVFQAIQEAVIVLDKDFRVKKANAVFYEFFAVTEEETEGVLLFDLGNRQWNILQLRELLEATTNGNTLLNEFEVTHDFPKIGLKTMVLKARRIFQKTHRQQLIVLSFLDITEHREAQRLIGEREEWFRNTANNVPAMICVADTQNNYTFFNDTWLRFTGRSLRQELKQGWMEGIYPEDFQPFLLFYNKHINKRLPFKSEFRLKRADGQYRWVDFTAAPTFNTDKKFLGFVGSCSEIHDKKLLLKELEEMVNERTVELKEAVRGLEETNTELNQYAFVASHDLQEPLRKIITFSDRLQKTKLSSTAGQEYLEKIITCAERMRTLINDLLNFSKTGRSSNEFVSTDLNLTVKDVLKDLEMLAEEKKAKVVIEKLPVIKAVPLQLHQLFYNLLNNALKFSKEKAPQKILIKAKKLAKDELKKYSYLQHKRDYIQIEVSDNGIGFKQEFAEQVFTIFQRLNSGDKYPGAGIGLALCRKVVANHKGLILVKSSQGKGTTFFVILPMEQ